MKFTIALFALIPLIHALPAPEGDLVMAILSVLYPFYLTDIFRRAHFPPAPKATCMSASRPPELNAHIHFLSFVCIDAGFTGDCTTLHGSSGECVNVPLVFNDNISGVRPDSGRTASFSCKYSPENSSPPAVSNVKNTARQMAVAVASDPSEPPVFRTSTSMQMSRSTTPSRRSRK